MGSSAPIVGHKRLGLDPSITPIARAPLQGSKEVEAEGLRAGIEVTEDYETVKRQVTHMLMHLSQNRLQLLQQLIGFAVKLSTLAGAATSGGSLRNRDREETLALGNGSLLNIIAPYIYRPYGTAHMSVRHKAHLMHVVPVLAFLFEHFHDVCMLQNNAFAVHLLQQTQHATGLTVGARLGTSAWTTGGSYSRSKSDGELCSLVPTNNTEQYFLQALRTQEAQTNAASAAKETISKDVALPADGAHKSDDMQVGSGSPPATPRSNDSRKVVLSASGSVTTTTSAADDAAEKSPALRRRSRQNADSSVDPLRVNTEPPGTSRVQANGKGSWGDTTASSSSPASAVHLQSWEWQVLTALASKCVGAMLGGISADEVLSPSRKPQSGLPGKSTGSGNGESQESEGRIVGSPDDVHVQRLSMLTIIDNNGGANRGEGGRDGQANSGTGAGGMRFAWGGGGAGVAAAQQLQPSDSTAFKKQRRSNSTASISSQEGGTYSTAGNGSTDTATSIAATISVPSIALSAAAGMQSNSLSAARQARRKAVSECRNLKQQITAYEATVAATQSESRARKPKEVQALYDRYKECKRQIRDAAATDIQKVMRGARVRTKVAAMAAKLAAVGAALANASSMPTPLGSRAASSAGDTMVTSSNNSNVSVAGMSISASGMSAGSVLGQLTSSSIMQVEDNRSSNSASGPVNVLSSLSFDAGLNVNQALNIRAYGRSPLGAKVAPANDDAGASATGTDTSAAAGDVDGQDDIIAHYRYLSAQKKQLKRELKRFDEDFLAQTGRQPRKSDKEALRPQYQRYHDLKGDLTRLRAVVEARFGKDAVPADDDVGADDPPELTTASTQPSNPTIRPRQQQIQQPVPQQHQRSASASPVDAAVFTEIAPAIPKAAEEAHYNAVQLQQLNEEKRVLHARLKAYERDFQQQYNRHVTRPEDIAPVSQEYKRYKEVKQILAAQGK